LKNSKNKIKNKISESIICCRNVQAALAEFLSDIAGGKGDAGVGGGVDVEVARGGVDVEVARVILDEMKRFEDEVLGRMAQAERRAENERYKFSKVPRIVALYSRYTRSLTFENLNEGCGGGGEGEGEG